MRTIIAISPHLDDAVLSYGGRLAQLASAGNQVIVYTVFAGTPEPPYSAAAEEFHSSWQTPDEPLRTRLKEDRAAVRRIGAMPVHGPFLDAIYRRDKQGAWLIKPGGDTDCGLFDEEPELTGQIAGAVEQLIIRHDPGLVVTCSATGAHIDHVRARDAAVLAAARAGVQLKLWEDLPYGQASPGMHPLPDGISLCPPEAEPVDALSWQKKLHAVSGYASQLDMLQCGAGHILDDLTSHAVRRGRGGSGGGNSPGYAELAWPTVFSELR
jgi:LmbE family N-acetylglucosaminyl deacetylase